MNTTPTNTDAQITFHYSTDDPIDKTSGPHIWIVDLDKPLSDNSTLASLSQDEWSRAKGLKDKQVRDRFLARCFHVRHILSSITTLPPTDIKYDRDSCGKPSLKGYPHLFFSISHSNEQLAVAVAFGREIGVDLEKFNEAFDPDQVASENFSIEDLEKIQALPQDHQTLAFYRIWTSREAVGKMMGNGMLPRKTRETNNASLVHLHTFEYTHNNERVLGAVALGDQTPGSYLEQY